MAVRNLFRPLAHFYWKIRNGIEIPFGNPAKHVVICGYPRGGTSLLYNMISSSIKGFHCEEFEKEAIYRLHRHGNYVTKFPLDILNVPRILSSNLLSKDIYFIVLVRDVRDVITSKHPLIPDRYFIGYKNSWWPQNYQFTEWNYNAPGIEAVHKAIREWSTRQDINLLKIHYETVVNDTDRVQRQIEEFVGITFAESFLDYHNRQHKHAYKYSGRYQAKEASLARESDQVDASRIAKWRQPEHVQIIRQQFSRYPELFGILIEEGYEKDRNWFSEIASAAR